MFETLVAPDVEAALCSWLSSRLVLPVGTRTPKVLPAGGVVRVQRTGGPRLGPVFDNPSIVVECWHDNAPAAAELASLAAGHVAAVEGEWATPSVWVNAVEVDGMVSLDDPDAPTKSRYQFTARLWLRLTALPV